MEMDRAKARLGGYNYQAIARLKPGVTVAQANADVARMILIEQRKFPAPAGFNIEMFKEARIGPNLRLLKQDVVGDIGKTLWVLMATIAMVLLIACANVANLLLVRAEGRQQELAIRAALGAGWRRIARRIADGKHHLGRHRRCFRTCSRVWSSAAAGVACAPASQARTDFH